LIFILLPVVYLLFGDSNLQPQDVSKSDIKTTQMDVTDSLTIEDSHDNENRVMMDTIPKRTKDTYHVPALKTPYHINFAGEPVPIEEPDVRERLDRELLVNNYWQSNMILMIKRGYKFFPRIEKILLEYQIPEDFKYLALIESGLLNVTSPAGARGYWQLMKATAREYGLEVNSNVDERLHLELSTTVACKYLLKAKERFGNWTLAAASYNRGMYGIARQLKKQDVDDYYSLWLTTETSRYVFRILAVKEIFENFDAKYGFQIDEEDHYHMPTFKRVALDTAITDLVSFAKNMGLNYKELKIHNPWLLQDHLKNTSRKDYEILIPKNHSSSAIGN